MKRIIASASAGGLLGAGATLAFSLTREPGLLDQTGALPEGASGTLILIGLSLAVFFFVLLSGARRMIAAWKRDGDSARRTVLRLVFVVVVVATGCAVFGLGEDLFDFFGRQIAEGGVFSLPAYYTAIGAGILVVVAGLANRGIVRGTFFRAAACALVSCLLMVTIYGVAGLPGESTLPPLVFNLVLSLSLSALIVSPWLAGLTGPGDEVPEQ